MKVDATLNHSAAHLLAAAVVQLYPDVKLGIGPAIDEGFYYDFQFAQPITDGDLVQIEKRMQKIATSGYRFTMLNEGQMLNQPFKDELIKELQKTKAVVSYYALLDPAGKSIFTDLCAGPHVATSSKVKYFKLLSLAGAYWRGDARNAQLTRIYGTAWETKDELEAYLALVADRKERDHRKIGREMNIFMFDQLAGQGFPIWLEDGMIVKNTIQTYIRAMDNKYGFREVSTPAFGAKELYLTSGHLAHYKDTMFPIIKVDNEELIMRPMTCPHHILIFGAQRRSYRDLPLRLSEQAQLYRYEKSGALTGLERVRSMELTEGHIFCRHDQIFSEFKNAYKLVMEVLERFAIKIDYISLSLRDKTDKEKYFDDDDMWDAAESDLRAVLRDLGVTYKEMVGEAAFYGPKIDIQVKTALGHEITLATLQLDFLLPRKFDVSYIDAAENKVTPILIHRGLIGTYERFMAILLEQTKGVFPFWLAPRQVTVIPVTDNHLAYATKVANKLTAAGIRVHLDGRNERVGKKIREAQISKTKFQFVLGDAEVAAKQVNVRAYGFEDTSLMTIAAFLKMVKAKAL